MVAHQQIVVTVRTRNEESNIERFCRSYQWADKILVADGGSTDRTVEIASQLPKVQVRPFKEIVFGENGQWRNPHGRHLNFLFEWAEHEGADWIIHDDCDSVPSRMLKHRARKILSWELLPDFVRVCRIYLWGSDQWLEKITKPTGKWIGSMWGWKAKIKLRASEVDPWKHELVYDAKSFKHFDLLPPDYCLLHYFCPDTETEERKRRFYDLSGEINGCQNPKDYGGPILPLERWMRE